MTPAWILDILAAVMLAVAAVSAARLAAAVAGGRLSWLGPASGSSADIDLAHLLMGIAMAGMLAPALATLPNTVWVVIFAVVAAWFAFRVIRDARSSGARSLAAGHCAPHLVHSAAMVYMFLAISAPPASAGTGMSGMGSAGGQGMPALGQPTLAFVFAVVLAAYCVWDLDGLSGSRYRLARASAAPRSAALAMAGAGAGATAGIAAQAGVPAPASASRSPGILLSAGITVACRLAMGVAMVFMLIIMI